ncbi:MAG TPA: agmatinase [Candidatus Nanopelagicaceae bacterium]|nr:agmatinase [Candidatus Nanopelagicaceae bacterium]
MERPKIPPSRRAQMEGPAYLGPTTFARAVGITEESELDSWRPDIAVMGAPWDDSTTYRPGARFGPRAVRTANYQIPEWHLDLEVAPFKELTVVDYGDAVCLPGQVEASHKAVYDRVREIASRRIIPVVIGGDHSITLPSATAVADCVGRGKLGIVHFDAHADTAAESFGNPLSHGTPMRRLVESGAVPGRNFVQIGLRGYWPPKEVFDWMREQGLRWHLMEEIWSLGVAEVVRRAVAEAMDGPELIYISVDIDVLDPGFAPGTGTPEPGGMDPADLLRAIRQVALHTPVVAMDVVEVAPVNDPAELTAQNANRCIMELISAVAAKRRGVRSLAALGETTASGRR